MYDLSKAKFIKEPYFVGYAEKVMDDEIYNKLLNNWPDRSLFSQMFDDKKSLNVRHVDYMKFIGSHKLWQKVYDEVHSHKFRDLVVDTINAHGGIIKHSPKKFTSRFEFSSMLAKNGNIPPHTDIPKKVITLVHYFRDPNWKDEWGGGTSVLVPKAIEKGMNYNKLGWEHTREFMTYPYIGNNMMIFLKNDVSLHAVYPMTGPKGEEFDRKSLTINFEVPGLGKK
jgi:hypothetical protein